MRVGGIAALLITAAADQLAKHVVLSAWAAKPAVQHVTPFFDLVFVHNTGVSFGLFAASGAQNRWAMIGVTALIAAALLGWMLKEKEPAAHIGLGMIVGGAVGNLIDRVVHGAVIDYLQLHVGSFYWPAFNVADAAICVGAGLIMCESLKSLKRTV